MIPLPSSSAALRNLKCIGSCAFRACSNAELSCAGWVRSPVKLRPAQLDGVKRIYFGHTHLPFRDYMHGGYCFHNTGSAVGKMEFHPLRFSLPE